jgi:hypothetical protein
LWRRCWRDAPRRDPDIPALTQILCCDDRKQRVMMAATKLGMNRSEIEQLL